MLKIILSYVLTMALAWCMIFNTSIGAFGAEVDTGLGDNTSSLSISNLPEYPQNGQKYWVVFREGYRNKRIEMSTCDSLTEPNTLWIKWNKNLTLQGGTKNGSVNQYYLNSSNEWEQIGTYGIFSDYATEVIASNLDVYDANNNLIINAVTYGQSYDTKFNSPFFKLREDTNQYLHQAMSYYISNKNYRNKLYWDSLNTWDSTFRIYDQIYSGKTEGVCHGIALSMCYAKNGDLDLSALNNGRATQNYWELGSIYDSDKTRFRDLVAYYQLTQLTANGGASYSVTKNGWHMKNLNQRLSEFLQKFKKDAERAQNEQKPFVFSFSYQHGNSIEGHSVVVCGYHYNVVTQTHEITIYDENTYSNVKYLYFTFPSDYSSFRFTDANGEYSNYWISDIWTCLKVYDIEKLYSNKNYTSISVVKGSEPVSANNTSELCFTANKKIKVVNESGKYIEFDGTNYKGNMTVYDCTLEDNLDGTFYWKLTVDRSAQFRFTDMDNDCEITGETNSGGFYVSSNRSESVDVNGKTISVNGQNYEFDVALQTQSGKDLIRMQGKAGGNTVVSDNNSTITAQSNQYVNDVEVISYAEDNVKEDNVDGTVKSFKVSDSTGMVINEEKLSFTFGDVNNDGKINSMDRIVLARYLAKWQGYSAEKSASDLNRDGTVDSKDRVILARRLAKWDGFTSLPYNN